MQIDSPILIDNQNLRTINPMIKEHFDASELEMTSHARENGLVRDPSLVDFISCPACGADSASQLLVKWGGRYDECKVCSHVFLKNPFKQQILTSLYKHSIVDQLNREVQKHSFNEGYWTQVYQKYMNFLGSHVPRNASLIDIGCGTGRFLRFCKNNFNFELFALDVYEGLVASLSSLLPLNNIFYVDAFEDSKLGKKFDVITLWGVLEHCRSPQNILSKCWEYLNDDGYILILIPNIHSRARKLLGVHTPTLNPREHINFFTQKSLELVASKCGFSIYGLYQELPVIDLMWAYIDRDSDIINEIIKNMESYYYVAILKKS
jgi:SAM-dependent methyltransferase